MSTMKIKKGDLVKVIAGKDKDKEGKVMAVNHKNNTVIVEGVNMVTKHKKPRSQTDPGGLVHQEAPIYACKVMHICNKCGKPTRLGHKVLADGNKARVCKNCLEVFED